MPGEPAVAQHGHAVADRRRLFQPVRHEHDRHAVLAQPVHDGEQPLHLRFRQRRGRLVHDDQAAFQRQRARDLDELLLGDRQRGNRRAGIDGQADAADDLARGVDHLAPVHQAERPDRRAADEDVFRHRQRRDQAEFLVDGDDARPLGILRARRLEFDAVEDDAAARRRLHTRQNLEQGGLAGAVLAKQAEDLAAPDLQRHVVQRRDAGEMLGHAFDGEKHFVSRGCCGLR